MPPRRVLLGHNVPRQIAGRLTGHEARTAAQMGWEKLANGMLIAEAEAAGFEVLLTADQNLAYQQNLTGRSLAIIVLSTNRRRAIEANVDGILSALGQTAPGSLARVSCPGG